MGLLKKIGVRISIHNLSLDSSKRIKDISISRETTYGNYVFNQIRPLDPLQKRLKKEGKRQLCENYKWRFEYKHRQNGNYMWICFKRENPVEKRHLVSGMMIYFGSGYLTPLRYRDVVEVENQIKDKHNICLRPSNIHLSIDIMHPNKIGLHKRVCRAIYVGKKRILEMKNDSLIFGSTKSGNQIVAYDKTKQLEEKNIMTLTYDVSRVELRMNIHRMGNFAITVEELGKLEWTFIYGKYISFHQPNERLRELLTKKDLQRPIWELKKIIMNRFQIKPSMFYRDYLKPHKWFSEAVREALIEFRWNPSTNKED